MFLSNSLFANTINLNWNVKTFYEPEYKSHYLEVYYNIPSNSLEYKTLPSGKIQASAVVSIKIINNSTTISEKNYLLNSPEYLNVFDNIVDLTDLLRFAMHYEDSLVLMISVSDKNNKKLFYSDTKKIHIEKPDSAFLSDIILVDRITETNDESNPFFRNGKEIVPKFHNFYSADENKLNFYVEFYQPEATVNYLVKYLISDDNSVLLSEYAGFKKVGSNKVEAFVTSFDISKLPSGNYNFYVELRDTENKLVDRKKTYIQRSNKSELVENKNYNELDVITNNFAKKYDLASIIHHTKALRPIAGEFEKAAITGLLTAQNLEDLQNYFFTFWKKRDASNAESLWMDYAEKLQFVEQRFSTSTERGFETERGLIYLKHGAPTERVERPNSPLGQHEIWYYEQLKNQSSVYFVFINQNRITEEYHLVHTNLIGEIYNKFWAEKIKNGAF